MSLTNPNALIGTERKISGSPPEALGARESSPTGADNIIANAPASPKHNYDVGDRTTSELSISDAEGISAMNQSTMPPPTTTFRNLDSINQLVALHNIMNDDN